jgi:hypothetical protein
LSWLAFVVCFPKYNDPQFQSLPGFAYFVWKTFAQIPNIKLFITDILLIPVEKSTDLISQLQLCIIYDFSTENVLSLVKQK